MTQFVWDASHYDGYLSREVLARAKAEGIVGFHHKIAEGLHNTEGGPAGDYDDTALAAARDAGIEFIGGYLVPRSGIDPVAQVAAWLKLIDQGERWLRTFPGRYWVIDLELWSYDKVPAATGVTTARLLRQQTGDQVLLYASHGMYGDQLSTWDGPKVNADYVGRTAAGFAAMYPGDSWTPLHNNSWRGGWSAYSGREPEFLQYTSQATVAGRTTCDVNAFRGSLDQLRALLRGDDVSGQDVWNYAIGSPSLGGRWADGEPAGEYLKFAVSGAAEVSAMHAELTAMHAELSAMRGVVETLATAVNHGGGSVDTAGILSGVDARLAAFRTALRADTRDAIADAEEGGAAAVRAGIGPAVTGS